MAEFHLDSVRPSIWWEKRRRGGRGKGKGEMDI
jgi:hypothetical protein